MTTIIIILIYIIGCILSFGRDLAGMYEIEEDYIDKCRCSYNNIVDYIKYSWTTRVIILSSWLGFLVGITMYYSEKDRYFLKFSFKDLNERWE